MTPLTLEVPSPIKDSAMLELVDGHSLFFKKSVVLGDRFAVPTFALRG